MKETGSQPAKNFLILSALGVGTIALLLALGFVPTQRLGGSGAVQAMLIGCAVSLFGSLIGTIPMLASQRSTPQMLLQGQLFAMLTRMVIVMAAALSIALGGWFDRAALLIWVAISYMALLVPETIWVVRQIRALPTNESL